MFGCSLRSEKTIIELRGPVTSPGAEKHAFPLYSLDDAERLRSSI
jgi:hypothetical protein